MSPTVRVVLADKKIVLLAGIVQADELPCHEANFGLVVLRAVFRPPKLELSEHWALAPVAQRRV
eukprot:1895026-Amphidinium_carterae.4